MTASKIVAAAASGAGSDPLDIDNVFRTFLYDGNGGTNNVVNNIDFSGEGGLVWLKRRESESNSDHALFDTERGATKRIRSNSTDQEYSPSDALTVFNNNGFTLGADANVNTNDAEYVSWNFRKAEKFFDVVKYTGTGSARTIAHNLGSAPGMMMIKKTSGSQNWCVYHRESHATAPEDYYARLNSTIAFSGPDTNMFNSTAPTSTVFSVGTDTDNNQSGQTYIAYLFAHNNNDGEFGPDADQDIIKCGHYISSDSNFNEADLQVNVGFEPQWLLVKRASADTEGNQEYHSWAIQDEMRGLGVAPYNQNAFAHAKILWANGDKDENHRGDLSSATGSNDIQWMVTPTGFSIPAASKVECNRPSGFRYIYMAIRRGPLAPPENASDVFDVDRAYAASGQTAQFTSTGFKMDVGLYRANKDGTGDTTISSRITGNAYIETNSGNAESSHSQYLWDYNTGFRDSSADPQHYAWMWKRAPQFCDVSNWLGSGNARTIPHSLGVAPEMIWVRARNISEDMTVYHKDIGNGKYLEINSTAGSGSSNSSAWWNSTTPTSSVFSVGTHGRVNASNNSYIGYLFTTLAGVSKVGSYTGTGSNQNIDCGFSSGARFVLIKSIAAGTNWMVFDSERGIISGTEPHLKLNSTNAESTDDQIDPYSGGFALTGVENDTNASGDTFVFYAIAA